MTSLVFSLPCPECGVPIDHVNTVELSHATAAASDIPGGKPCLKLRGCDGMDFLCPECGEEISDAFDLVNSDL